MSNITNITAKNGNHNYIECRPQVPMLPNGSDTLNATDSRSVNVNMDSTDLYDRDGISLGICLKEKSICNMEH